MFKLDDNFDIALLNKFMLYNITDSRNIEDSDKNDKNYENTKPHFNNKNKFVNYNKKYSKYNEPNIIKSKQIEDKLFWCFYKIYKNYTDKDLDTINYFVIEKEFKYKVSCDLVKNKNILKLEKINRSFIEDELINNKKISLKTFKCLCLLFNLNIIIVKENNTYTKFCYNHSKSEINSSNFKVIRFTNYHSNKSQDYDIIIDNDITNDEIEMIINNYYLIENLDKPLKSISSYKVEDLINICKKLDISIYGENTKIKKKNILYENILKILE